MNGWRGTNKIVCLIYFKLDSTPHLLVDKESDAETYCKRHHQFDYDSWEIQTKRKELSSKIKRANK